MNPGSVTNVQSEDNTGARPVADGARLGLIGTAVPAALLASQLILIGWLAPRGLDLTDESATLLYLSHWRDMLVGSSLFPTLLGPLLSAVDHSVALIRIVATLALVASSGWLAWSLLRLYRSLAGVAAPIDGGFVIAGMAAGLLHYSFAATLRVPSYNLLVLVAMSAATALLCAVLDPRAGSRRRSVAAAGYGAMVMIAGLTKATSGAAMLVCHGFAALLLWPGLPPRRTLSLMAVAALGGVGVGAVLHLLQPHWWRILLDGVALAQQLDGRSPAVVFRGLGQDLVQGFERLGADRSILVVGLLGLAHLLAVRWRPAVAWVAGAAFAIAVVGSLLRGYGKMWWALYALALCLCAAILWRCSPPTRGARELRTALSLGAMLMTLPVAFSLGTNGSLPAHTQMASSFAAIALLLVLWRLGSAGLLDKAGTAACLAIVASAGLWVQWPALHDAGSAYRLGAGLISQSEPVAVGAGRSTLQVDKSMQRDTESLRALAADAGFAPGTPLIDLTGDGPGWVYLLDGRPPGIAWIVGGYAGSARAADSILRRLPRETLRRSWVLTAEGNDRAITDSPDWLRAIDPGLRFRRVGSVVVERRYSFKLDRDPRPLRLLLWRPADDGGG